MIGRFKQLMLRNYLGKQFPLDYRVYMIFFFECFLLSILSALTNTILNKGLPGLILQWTYIACCTVMLFVPPGIRLALQKPNLLFVTFFYIPFLYFQTGGYEGTALMFVPLGLFLLSIVFSGRTRMLVITLNILDYLACILINRFYPHIVIPHSGPDAMLLDLVVATVISFTGLAILTVYISRVFRDHSKTMAELSIRDALTGVYNRRFMIDFLQQSLDTAKQTGNKFYVLMLDIDHFKRVNDTYGHGFGDHVLMACTQAISSVLRKGDVIVRYGGEEFAVVLLAAPPTKAIAIAERIRAAISSLRFRHDVTVTVSIGAARSEPDDTIEMLLGRADACMYQAKQAGRNRVVHSGDTAPACC